MKIVRFRHDGRDRYGALENDRITALDGTIEALTAAKGSASVALSEVRLLAPVTPSKIVAIGLNYADHAAEGNRELPKETMLFIKPSTAVIGPGDEIKFVIADRADYEWTREIVSARELPRRTQHLLLSAVFGKLDPRQLVEWVLEDRLPVRVQLQLHKIIWSPDATGV